MRPIAKTQVKASGREGQRLQQQGGVELDVGLQRAVGLAVLQDVERRPLHRLGEGEPAGQHVGPSPSVRTARFSASARGSRTR